MLKDFSESQRKYLLHQERLEAEYLRNTWIAEFKKMRKYMEPEKIEQLLLLLKKLGIDPDQDEPPEILNAEEKWKNYLLHQERLEAEYVRNTWIAEIKRLQKETEELRKETETEELRKLRKETEMEQKKTERLRLLLKKAGVDPDQTVH